MVLAPPQPDSVQCGLYTYYRCSNGAYYVGCTQNVDVRVYAHSEGRAAAFTRCHRPVALVYTEAIETELDALRREKQIKGWSRWCIPKMNIYGATPLPSAQPTRKLHKLMLWWQRFVTLHNNFAKMLTGLMVRIRIGRFVEFKDTVYCRSHCI